MLSHSLGFYHGILCLMNQWLFLPCTVPFFAGVQAGRQERAGCWAAWNAWSVPGLH